MWFAHPRNLAALWEVLVLGEVLGCPVAGAAGRFSLPLLHPCNAEEGKQDAEESCQQHSELRALPNPSIPGSCWKEMSRNRVKSPVTKISARG